MSPVVYTYCILFLLVMDSAGSSLLHTMLRMRLTAVGVESIVCEHPRGTWSWLYCNDGLCHISLLYQLCSYLSVRINTKVDIVHFYFPYQHEVVW